MWYRLAATLGMTVAQARRVISPDEFLGWCAWFSLEPRGDERLDWNAALIAGHAAHIMASGGTRWRLSDFKLEFGQGPQKTAEELEMMATAWAVAHNRALRRDTAEEDNE